MFGTLLAPLLVLTAAESAAWDRWQCEHYLPPNALARTMLMVAGHLHQQLRNNTGPDKDDADYRVEVWAKIYVATSSHRTWVDRREALNDLIRLIGPEDYLRGQWPNPVPPWRCK